MFTECSLNVPGRVDLEVPPEPPQMYGMYNIKGSGMFGPTVPYPEMREYRKTAVKVRQTNSELHSLRCDFEYKVEVGKMLQNETAFYYPHNVDFRGRAYTMHPHLNHLGADVSRGLLQFADPVPLGESGFYWLMVHLANKYANGVDKYPMQGRFDFSEKHLPDIIDSAENPVHGRQFWKEAEDPFQFLAACREVRDALLAPQLTAFGSRLPVHQDGSCNGLQHYAALGRDAQGGRAVNLVPGDSPADVYTGIADIVRKRVARDAEGLGDVTPQVQEFAQAVLPHVDRKLVKQTVMTSVYGVTFVGARQQIQARLKERNALAEEMRYRAACYAARSTLQGLDEMFTNAREVMDWLGEAASIVATTGDSVRWRTPLGLPVLQPYRRRGRKIVKTILQNFIVEYENDTLPVRLHFADPGVYFTDPGMCFTNPGTCFTDPGMYVLHQSRYVFHRSRYSFHRSRHVFYRSRYVFHRSRCVCISGGEAEAEERVPAQLRPLHRLLAHDAYRARVQAAGPGLRRRPRLLLDARRDGAHHERGAKGSPALV
jgi:DNA-directed RNA polymerase